MNYVLKSIFFSLALMMGLSFAFCQDVKIQLSVKDGQLQMDDHGCSKIKGNNKVHWVATGKKIKNFYIQSEDGTDIFYELLNTNPTSDLMLTVKKGAPEGEWAYSIIWYDEFGRHTNDPKLAVLATTLPFGGILLYLWGILGTLMSIGFFAKWRNAKAVLVKNNQQNNI